MILIGYSCTFCNKFLTCTADIVYNITMYERIHRSPELIKKCLLVFVASFFPFGQWQNLRVFLKCVGPQQ